MSYFRHAPLAYWAAGLLILITVFVIGIGRADQYTPVAAVPATPTNSAEEAAYVLAADVAGANVAFMGGDSSAWAADFEKQVRVAAALYEEDPAAHTAALDALWASALDAADDLSAFRGDDPFRRQQLASTLSSQIFALAYQYRQS